MDPTALEAAITPATVAIVPVHMRGAGADLAAILAIAERHGLAVLEDAAQAVGGHYRGRRLGTFGKIGCFSLQYHKTITTGEGGMVVSDDTVLYERAVRYHDQGSVRVEELDELIPEGSPLIIGVNYRMSELTAAVGVAQLGKMDWIIGQMRAHKERAVRGRWEMSAFAPRFTMRRRRVSCGSPRSQSARSSFLAGRSVGRGLAVGAADGGRHQSAPGDDLKCSMARRLRAVAAGAAA